MHMEWKHDTTIRYDHPLNMGVAPLGNNYFESNVPV